MDDWFVRRDMLEVGQIMDPATKQLDVAWNQAHFGAWCIVSSPLTLGLNLLSPELPKIIPFITNKVKARTGGSTSVECVCACVGVRVCVCVCVCVQV